MQKARVATEVFEWYESILLAFLPCSNFFWGARCRRFGESMYPTLDEGNQLFVQTLTSSRLTATLWWRTITPVTETRLLSG